MFIETFVRELGDFSEVEVVIVPPFTAIAKVTEALGAAQNIKVGAQNMHWEKERRVHRRNQRGDVARSFCALMSCSVTANGARFFGETDEIVNRKVRAAHEATLRPIVCVGETLEQRERGDVERY